MSKAPAPSPSPSDPRLTPSPAGSTSNNPNSPMNVWRAEAHDTTAKLEDVAQLIFERNKRAKLNLSTEAKDAEIADLMHEARQGISRLESMLSSAEEKGSLWVP